MRARVSILIVIGGASALAACASLLGIDDGVPREDAGVADAAADVAPEASPFDAAIDVTADVFVDVAKPFSPLACGTATCNAVGQVCCRTGAGGDAGYVFKCLDDAGACSGTSPVVVSCDRQSNCAAQGNPGHVCCANAFQTAATKASCTAPSFCPPSTFTIVCGPGDDELCADAGLACLPSSTTIVGWNICK